MAAPARNAASSVALSEKLLKELSYGSRFTFVANWHSDSNHPSDLATRRPARLGVTNTAAKGSGGHRRGLLLDNRYRFTVTLLKLFGLRRRVDRRRNFAIGSARST
jgi:hypothetical protein